MKSCDGKYAKLGPMRVLSFDIEVSSPNGKTPIPEKDPIVTIGNVV